MVHSGELSCSRRHDFLLRDCKRKLQTTVSLLLTVHTTHHSHKGQGQRVFPLGCFDTLSDITVLWSDR